ncbi:MAG: acetyltransferase [Candidatus Omnitrophota bacterium]
MKNVPERVFLYGSGGHAKVIIDILRLNGVEVAVCLDDDPAKSGGLVMGVPIRYAPDELARLKEQGVLTGIVGIGNNRIREEKAALLRAQGFRLAATMHPAAIIARDVVIGDGTAVMAGVVVNCGARIGENAILNTSCSVDHDCIVGDNVHISPGARLGGTVVIGDGTQIGIGAVVLPNLKIGRNVIVGGGAAVIGDLPDSVTAVGVPARIIPQK